MPRTTPIAEPDAVEALLAKLDHDRKDVIQALRSIVGGAAPGIVEGVKWNAPSFATVEHFATFHLRKRDRVQIVLHLGARARLDVDMRREIEDPEGLLEWRGSDRATVSFRDLEEVAAREAPLAAVLRAWITHLA